MKKVIVVFHPNVEDVDECCNRLVQTHNGQRHRTYKEVLHGFSATLPDEEIAALEQDPDVDYVEEDKPRYANVIEAPASWGLDRIDQRDRPLDEQYEFNFTGTGVHAYIIDTGIRSTHNEFTGRIGNGADFVDDDNGTEDCNGHGTHVAGTVGGTTYGVAKDVTLHPLRVLDCEGRGFVSDVIAAYEWVSANHIKPAVANVSLGGPPSNAEDAALRASINAGVHYVVAAGNEDQSACNPSPARVAEALTVGATNAIDRRAPFSNWGSCVDLFAPGVNIVSAVSNSDTATATFSGTSMSSPHVAGVVALYLEQFGDDTGPNVHQAIRDNASVDKLSNIKSGSPNLLAHSLWPLQECPDLTERVEALENSLEEVKCVLASIAGTLLGSDAITPCVPPE